MYCMTRDLAHLQQGCGAGIGMLLKPIGVFLNVIAPAAL